MSPRVERFCRLVVMGRKPADAWKACWNEDASDAEAKEKAAKVLKRENVKARIKELMEQAAEGVVMDKHKLLVKISGVIERADDTMMAGLSKLIGEFAKMCGYYEAAKIEVKHGLTEDAVKRAQDAMQRALEQSKTKRLADESKVVDVMPDEVQVADGA